MTNGPLADICCQVRGSPFTTISMQVGDFFGTCEIIVSGDGRNVEIDAIAEAGAEAAAYACNGDRAEAEVDVLAKATATALAEAVAQADVFCESQGDYSSACGLGDVQIREIARAQVSSRRSLQVAIEASLLFGTCGCPRVPDPDTTHFVAAANVCFRVVYHDKRCCTLYQWYVIPVVFRPQ